MEAKQVNKIQEEVLHQPVFKIAGDNLLKEIRCSLRSPQVFQYASRGEAPSKLHERFTKLLMQSFEVVEPQQRLLWGAHGDEAVDRDDLCEPDQTRIALWNH